MGIDVRWVAVGFSILFILPKRDAELERLMAPKFEPMELQPPDILSMLFHEILREPLVLTTTWRRS